MGFRHVALCHNTYDRHYEVPYSYQAFIHALSLPNLCGSSLTHTVTQLAGVNACAISFSLCVTPAWTHRSPRGTFPFVAPLVEVYKAVSHAQPPPIVRLSPEQS